MILPLLLVIAGVGVPAARADAVYAISFTGADAPTVVGSDLITYNSTLEEFTTPSIEINILGSDSTLTALGGTGVDPTTDSFVWGANAIEGVDVSDTGSQPLYGSTAEISGIAAGCGDGPGYYCLGDVTLTAQTPEPLEGVLTLLGIGMVFVMRKRIANGLPTVA
jgi:hypothetical protein